MAKILFFLFSFAGVFCLGQWSALQGYTLERCLLWAQAEAPKYVPMKSLESLWKQAGVQNLPVLGQLWNATDASRKVAPHRVIPGSSAKEFKPQTGATAKIENQTSPDEEGLSPTDREALLDLLK